MKKFLFTLLIATCATMTYAQQTGDTIIVELAKTSRVEFTIKDRSDLEILKHYNFNELFHDLLAKLEKIDTTALAKIDSSDVSHVAEKNDDENWHHHDNDDDGDDDDNNEEWHHHRHN